MKRRTPSKERLRRVLARGGWLNAGQLSARLGIDRNVITKLLQTMSGVERRPDPIYKARSEYRIALVAAQCHAAGTLCEPHKAS